MIQLVGTSEAAEILGVEVPRITRWRKAERLPPLVADLKATPVWRRTDISRFARERERKGVLPKAAGWERPDLDDSILGTAEVAEVLGERLGRKVDKSQVGRWRRAGTFPKPTWALNATPIWTGEQISEFAETRTRETAAA